MSDDWIAHEIKKPIDFSNMTPAAFEEWARGGLAIPIIQEQEEDVPLEEEIPIEDADLFFEDEEGEEDDTEGIIIEED